MRSYTEDSGLWKVGLIASDMDCTLLADDKTMPPQTFELVRRLADVGVTFAAASGRPLCTLREMFSGVGCDMGFVSDNGASVSFGEKAVFTSLIEKGTLERLVRFTLESGRGCPVVCGLDRAHCLERDRAHSAALEPFYRNVEYVDTPEELICEANKFTVYFPERNSVAAYEEVFAPEFGEALSVTPAGDEWIDFMNPGVDKGTGILRLCEYLGVELEDALALGDTDNDAEMLDAVGHACLVSNAERRMWEHADFLAPSNNERGVAQVMEAVLAAKRG